MNKFPRQFLFIFLFYLTLSLPFTTLALTKNTGLPGQLGVQILQLPTPMIAENKAYLVYELYLTNFTNVPAALTSLDIKSEDKGNPLFHFENKELASMLVPAGDRNTKQLSQTMPASSTKIAYIWLPFKDMNSVPDKLIHHITFNAEYKKEMQEFDVMLDPIMISKVAPITVALPLKGKYWVAANGPSNASIHRRTLLVVNGHPYLSQRYAIDFLQIDAKTRLTYHGDEHSNASYYCYDQPIYSVANGKVISMKDGIPENIPNSGQTAVPITKETVGGNNVVIEIAKGRYAFYAHLRPGSNKHLHVGDYVKTGEVIGRIGNTGNTSEPHLHFHVVDGPSFVSANGVPYAFDTIYAYTNQWSDKKVKIDEAQRWIELRNQLVLENTLVNFPE